MSADTVNVPREPTEAMLDNAACYERADALKRIWSAMLAASPSVGGWEDISTAPKRWLVERTRTNGVICWSTYEHELQARTVAKEEAQSWASITVTPLYAAPPPPSVSTGSRPQEAVPTNQKGNKPMTSQVAINAHCAEDIRVRAHVITTDSEGVPTEHAEPAVVAALRHYACSCSPGQCAMSTSDDGEPVDDVLCGRTAQAALAAYTASATCDLAEDVAAPKRGDGFALHEQERHDD